MPLRSIVEVIIPAYTYDLVSVSDVVLELGLSNPTANDLALIQKHISAVSTAISKHCDRIFVSETVQETIWEPLNAHGLYNRAIVPITYSWQAQAQSLYLKRYPITAIDTIYVDDVLLGSDSNDLSLRLDNDNGILYRLQNGYTSTWNFSKSIVATYIGGYTEIPADIQRIAIRWSEMAWFSSGQDSNIKSEQVYNIASVSYSTSSDNSSSGTNTSQVPEELKLLLEPYCRKWNFA